MTFEEIMQFLEEHENPDGKKVLMRHGELRRHVPGRSDRR